MGDSRILYTHTGQIAHCNIVGCAAKIDVTRHNIAQFDNRVGQSVFLQVGAVLEFPHREALLLAVAEHSRRFAKTSGV